MKSDYFSRKMQFDTRDKKPKLWNVAILSAAVLALIVGLISMDAEKHAALVSGILSVYLAVVLVLLIRAFFGQLHYNPYSYNTIIYMGFALFLLTVWITQVYLFMQMLSSPEKLSTDRILFLLMNSAKNFMFLSLPFVLTFSVALCISNLALIRHEGRRLVNILGIVLSVLLLAGEAFLVLYDHSASSRQSGILRRDLFVNLFAAVYLYFECMLIGAIVADVIAARYEPKREQDYLILLGCGLRKDGTPSPLLRGRIERGLAFAEKQRQESRKGLVFVTSGGQGADEACSESAAMKRFLMARGIPEEQILEEDRSTSTLENMLFSKEKISETGSAEKIAFVTTNYHVFRAGLCARRVKMRAQGIGAKTRWYFWPNASVREFVGLLTEHRGKQALLFLGLLAFYSLLTLLAGQ